MMVGNKANTDCYSFRFICEKKYFEGARHK